MLTVFQLDSSVIGKQHVLDMLVLEVELCSEIKITDIKLMWAENVKLNSLGQRCSKGAFRCYLGNKIAPMSII